MVVVVVVVVEGRARDLAAVNANLAIALDCWVACSLLRRRDGRTDEKKRYQRGRRGRREERRQNIVRMRRGLGWARGELDKERLNQTTEIDKNIWGMDLKDGGKEVDNKYQWDTNGTDEVQRVMMLRRFYCDQLQRQE
jgi:hypothetical protein